MMVTAKNKQLYKYCREKMKLPWKKNQSTSLELSALYKHAIYMNRTVKTYHVIRPAISMLFGFTHSTRLQLLADTWFNGLVDEIWASLTPWQNAWRRGQPGQQIEVSHARSIYDSFNFYAELLSEAPRTNNRWNRLENNVQLATSTTAILPVFSKSRCSRDLATTAIFMSSQ